MRHSTAPPFVIAALGLASVLPMAACASAPNTPVEALTVYTSALRDGRYSDAWMLLTPEARAAMPYETFARAAADRPADVRDAIAALERLDPSPALTAHLDLETGETVDLVRTEGRWRLSPAALDFYAQHTPRQALGSFVRALERERWDVLLRLAPRHVAERMTAEGLRTAWTGGEANRVQGMLNAMREALERGAVIDVAGDRATFTYGMGGRFVAQLLREGGRWTVEQTQ